MKAFQAYANGGFRLTSDTPRAAATSFFVRFPAKRKCDVIQGDSSGDGFFTITFSHGGPPSWRNVTKKTAGDLPDAS